MFNISNNRIFFLSAVVGLLFCSCSIKLTKYEYTTLQNMNNTYSKLIMNPKIYMNMQNKPKANEWFIYYKENEKHIQKISQVNIKNNQYEILLSGNKFLENFTLISYKKNKSSLIESIFSI